MKNMFILMVCGLLLLTASGAQALTVTNSGLYLNEIVDGESTVTDLWGSGTGTFSRTYTAPGTYNILSFIDNEIDLELTGWDPEFGAVVGTPGFSYQVADPYDLIANFLSGSLDNTVNPGPADVAVAMGWAFTLLDGQMAEVNFLVGGAEPSADFLMHIDAVYVEPDYQEYELLDNGTIYYASTLNIESLGNNPIPEPSTFVLFSTALAVLGFCVKRRRNS